MQSLREQLTEYQRQHQNRNNLTAHAIGVPAITLSILLLLSWISISIVTRWHITFSWIAVIIALYYYYRLDVKLAAVMTLVLIVLTLICSWIAYPSPTPFSAVLFVILFFGGWIALFVGHAFENNRPVFTTNLLQILVVAPLSLLIEVIVMLNLSKHFNLDEFILNNKKNP